MQVFENWTTERLLSLISIVIPALNEADTLPKTLRHLQRQPGPKEIIVVDGGSTDGTVSVAREAARDVRTRPDADVRVVTAGRGRARQMNCGAERATGDALLFLHADTQLPPDGLDMIRKTLRDGGTDAGIFRLSFDRNTPLLRFYAFCTHLSWIRLAFGDRGLFVTRDAFDAVGGFPDWPIFEDLELADRLHRQGGFAFVPHAVVTSARRFEKHGALRQQLRNLALWLAYCLGVDPDAVAGFYGYE